MANFGSYNKTYGSLGGVIVFLIWLWISNIALLLGAELNAELERGRELEAASRRSRRSRSSRRNDAEATCAGGGLRQPGAGPGRRARGSGGSGCRLMIRVSRR